MMIRSYEAEVSEDGRVWLHEPLTLQSRHRAVLTILEPLGTERRDVGESLMLGDSESLLRFLRENRLPAEMCLSADEINAQIAAEREAWD
ncbi:MAG: hypothetical protein H7829_04045 [Magnetococcus sp. THC-1_WYH]